MYDLPLFPLNTVLFPGMPINLHIFEDRYKKMIHDCTLNDSKFGVVLINRGEEALGPLAFPYSIGCVAKIIKLETLSHGRYNLTAVGKERFETKTIKQNDPYLVGVVEEYPIKVGESFQLNDYISVLRDLLYRYIDLLNQGEEIKNLFRHVPDDPVTLGYLGAVILQIPDKEKQVFLETRTTTNLMKLLLRTYQREVPLLTKLSSEKEPDPQGSFSLN